MPKIKDCILNAISKPIGEIENVLAVSIYELRKTSTTVGTNVASALFTCKGKFFNPEPATSNAWREKEPSAKLSFHSERLSLTHAIQVAIRNKKPPFDDKALEAFLGKDSITIKDIQDNSLLLDALKAVDIHIFTERIPCQGSGDGCDFFIKQLETLLGKPINVYYSIPGIDEKVAKTLINMDLDALKQKEVQPLLVTKQEIKTQYDRIILSDMASEKKQPALEELYRQDEQINKELRRYFYAFLLKKAEHNQEQIQYQGKFYDDSLLKLNETLQRLTEQWPQPTSQIKEQKQCIREMQRAKDEVLAALQTEKDELADRLRQLSAPAVTPLADPASSAASAATPPTASDAPAPALQQQKPAGFAPPPQQEQLDAAPQQIQMVSPKPAHIKSGEESSSSSDDEEREKRSREQLRYPASPSQQSPKQKKTKSKEEEKESPTKGIEDAAKTATLPLLSSVFGAPAGQFGTTTSILDSTPPPVIISGGPANVGPPLNQSITPPSSSAPTLDKPPAPPPASPATL